MYSPSLHGLLVQAHIKELHRSRQTWNVQPIITNERIAARHQNAVKLPACVAHAIKRFVGRPAPEAYAF